jgi:hypothetical protein
MGAAEAGRELAVPADRSWSPPGQRAHAARGLLTLAGLLAAAGTAISRASR